MSVYNNRKTKRKSTLVDMMGTNNAGSVSEMEVTQSLCSSFGDNQLHNSDKYDSLSEQSTSDDSDLSEQKLDKISGCRVDTTTSSRGNKKGTSPDMFENTWSYNLWWIF